MAKDKEMDRFSYDEESVKSLKKIKGTVEDKNNKKDEGK